MEQNKENIKRTETTEETGESLAMEILKSLKVEGNAYKFATICSTIISAGLIAATVTLGVLFYRNDCHWRDLFASCDYVSQYGSGQNYYNAGIGGDVNNGTTGSEQER